MSQRKYDPQLKQEVIESVMEGSKPAAQVARDYGIKESTVYTWIKSYKRQNDQARLKLNNETPEQELKRLRAEVRQLKLDLRSEILLNKLLAINLKSAMKSPCLYLNKQTL